MEGALDGVLLALLTNVDRWSELTLSGSGACTWTCCIALSTGLLVANVVRGLRGLGDGAGVVIRISGGGGKSEMLDNCWSDIHLFLGRLVLGARPSEREISSS